MGNNKSLTKPIICFLMVAILSWLINFYQHPLDEIIVSFLYLFRWAIYSSVYFCFSLSHCWLIGFGVVSAVLGLLQYIFFPDLRHLAAFGWDEHYYRVTFPFLDPGFTGMIYVLTLILLTERLWRQKSTSYVTMWLCSYVAMVLTYSRSSYLAYLVAMGVISWLKKSRRFFIGSFLLLMVTIFLLPRPGGEGIKLKRTSTIQARIVNYKNSLRIIKDQPLFGVGFNFYRYAQRDYGFLKEDWRTNHAGAGADSSLLFVWATTGIFGLIAYLWLLWEMIKIRPAATLALVVHSFFNNSLFYSWIMLWIWILTSSSVLLPATSSTSIKTIFSPSERVKG